MRVRDWLYVIWLWAMSAGCFLYFLEAVDMNAWLFAFLCLAIANVGAYLSVSHWWYRSKDE